MDPNDALRDRRRLAALQRTHLLDTPAEAAFDRLTRLAARILNAPIALVTLVDENRQFFKSEVGLAEPWASQRETPLSHSFSQHAVAAREPLIIVDARAHPLVRDNLAIRDLGVVAYAGIPLIDQAGHALGSFCAIDTHPREWTAEDIEVLMDLAAGVMTEIELRAVARAAVREVEEKRALLESSADGVFGLDQNGRCTFINRAGATRLGYAQEELVGQALHDLIHCRHAGGSRSPGAVCPMLNAVRTGQTVRMENDALLRRDGTTFPVEYTVCPMWEGQRIAGAVIRFSDITSRRRPQEMLRQANEDLERRVQERTIALSDANAWLRVELAERKRVEEALRESQEQFRILFEHSPDAILLIDPHHPDGSWPIIACNSIAAALHGYAREDLIGRSLAILDPSFETPGHGAAHLANLRRTGSLQGESFHHSEAGTLFPIEYSSSLITIGGRELVLSLDRDISERKRIEQRSAAFATLGHELGVATTAEAAGRIIARVADSLLRWDALALTLYARDENLLYPVLLYDLVNGERIEALVDTSGHPPAGITMQTLVAGPQLILHRQQSADDPYLVPFGDTARPSASLMFVPIRSAAGITGILTIQSYTPQAYTEADLQTLQALADHCGGALERIRAEEALQQAKDELELRVRERTAELRAANARLQRELVERQRVEERLAHFAALVESSQDAIFSASLDGSILSWNQAAEQLYGYAAAEVIGRSVSLLVPPEQRDEAWEALGRIRAGERVETYEAVRVRKDGQPVDVAVTLSPIADSSGAVSAVSVIVRDIRERKRTEDLLRRQTAVLQEQAQLLDLAHDTIKVCDMQKAITFWNRGAEEMYGWKKAEAEGSNCDQLLRTQYPSPVEEIDAELLRTGRWEGELVQTRRDGTSIVVASRWALRRDARGQPAATLEINTNITDRKRAEIALRQAKEEAERANRAKSEFLSRMSHELRTPLNAILGFAQLLEMGALAPPDRASVERILTAGRHLLGLINEVLDIARIEAGRLDVTLEPITVHELFAESLELVRPLATQRGLSLMVEDGADAKRQILADRQQLKQVLLNLLANAIKYNRDDGAVSLSCTDTAEERLRIMVSDTGAGIRPEALAKLFEPFERLDAAQTGIQGSGLGLTLTKRLVEAMGGAIGVESALGEGSVFWVDLPVAESAIERVE